MILRPDLIPEQAAAVQALIAEHAAKIAAGACISADGGIADEHYLIRPGEVRHSRGGAPWVRFGASTIWYRAVEEITDPITGAGPWRIVCDAIGAPLGCAESGLVVVTELRGRVLAHCVNTGWNYEREVIWAEVAQ